MSGVRLFGRKVALELGTSGVPGKRFTDLTVKFTVDMSDDAEPNKATIEVYNLAQETIALAQQSGAIVRLYAGYEVPLLIFQGNPVAGGVKISRQGPDRILKIEGQDGGTEYSSSHIAVSYATETTAEQVFEAVFAQMGLARGVINLPTDVRFPSGIVLQGPARTVLDRIARMAGRKWSIRDGALYMLGESETSGVRSALFSVAAGNLIGEPSPKDDGIEVKALMVASMRPGDSFRVESENYSGDYKATKIKFTGNSRAQDFYVNVSGTPL